MVYRWAQGTHLPKEADPQAIGERLARLREEFGEGYTPNAIVEDARRSDSPLHAAFAELWSLTAEEALDRALQEHAAYIVRHVRIVTVRVERGREVRDTRPAFVSIVERESGGRRYLPVARALSDADYREQTLEEAYRYFLSGRQRFRDLAELSDVFRAIDTAIATRRRHSSDQSAPDQQAAAAV